MAEPRIVPHDREYSADLYRVAAVVIVVIGHWLLSAVTFRGGRFGFDEVLAEMPWTQWLTWFFQVVPVFFLVAGYANAASWTRRRETGATRRDWLRHRVDGILGPTTAYVAVLLAAVSTAVLVGVDGSQLSIPGWVVALHLWFIPVYLGVVSLTPLAMAAQQRWGLKVPAAMTIGVALIDAATLGGHVPFLGSVNYLLCWGAIYQTGVAWFGGAFTGRRPAVLAAGAAVVLAIVISLGCYPVAMIGVTGQSVQNTSPPSLALLALAGLQSGLLLGAAPAVTAWLRRARWRPLLVIANENALALYLWHMVPVVLVALACYPTNLIPQPNLGSGAWWQWRFVWIVILAAVTGAELALLYAGRSWFARPIQSVSLPLPLRWSRPLLVVGTLCAAWALTRLSAGGVAPDGHLPTHTALIYVAGVAMVAVHPAGFRHHSTKPHDVHGEGVPDPGGRR